MEQNPKLSGAITPLTLQLQNGSLNKAIAKLVDAAAAATCKLA